MPTSAPPLPSNCPKRFRSTVHGVVFGDRAAQVDEVHAGDSLDLHPGLPEETEEAVWVHRRGGDLLGHLPGEIGSWLAPWLRAGGVATATALKVHDDETPSWRRLVVQVECREVDRSGGGGA